MHCIAKHGLPCNGRLPPAASLTQPNLLPPVFCISAPFLLQIISLVQSSGTSGLTLPPPDQLRPGALACYPQFVALVQACWARDPADRPHFDAIVQQLM
jgi:hypothetical protein